MIDPYPRAPVNSDPRPVTLMGKNIGFYFFYFLFGFLRHLLWARILASSLSKIYILTHVRGTGDPIVFLVVALNRKF